MMVIGSACLLITAPLQSSHKSPVCILAPVAITHLLCNQSYVIHALDKSVAICIGAYIF